MRMRSPKSLLQHEIVFNLSLMTVVMLASAHRLEAGLSHAASKAQADDGAVCADSGGPCTFIDVYNGGETKRVAEEIKRNQESKDSTNCGKLMQKNEGDIVNFAGENEDLKWEGGLKKMNGNCKVYNLEVTGKNMGIKVKVQGEPVTAVCGSCEFTAIPLKIYDYYLFTEKVARGVNGVMESTVIPRNSDEEIVEKLPKPASGSCGCKPTCKLVPPQVKKTKYNFSNFSVSLAQAGVSPVPVPLCQERVDLSAPQADGVPFSFDPRGTPDFCDDRYSKTWSDVDLFFYDYWQKLTVDVGNHEQGDEPSLCRKTWNSNHWIVQAVATPLLYSAFWFRDFDKR